MNLPRFSVARPVFTSMVTLIVVILGIVAYTRLKIDLLPNIERPTVSVRTGFEGASPEVMEQQVTQILEEIIATVPGVESMWSDSGEGFSNISVTFTWGTNIDAAAVDLQATLEDEVNELPDEITGPRVNKFDINSFPIVLLGVSSNIDPIELTDIIENQLRQRFTRVPGVAQVDMWGGYEREIRIEVDPERVKALGLSMNTILQALRDANLDVPTGSIEEGLFSVTLRAPAQFDNVREIAETALLKRDGSVVTVGQIAEVKDTHRKLNRIIRINGKPGVRMAIRKEAEANTVEVSRGILEEIEAINHAFPQLEAVAVSNQGNFIERSIQNVTRSVLYGGVLAILVLLFFLQNIRSTIVISLAIPISIIATFTLLHFGGFTINLMTLGGLALGMGMMVDSSIVVLENIFRRRQEEQEDTPTAAAKGASEVASAIIASTITTLVIFLPIVFMEGVSGLLFQDLAYVIVFSLFCSLLVSLSVVPMLASKILRRKHTEPHTGSFTARLGAKASNLLGSIDDVYRSLLASALRHRLLTVLLSLGITVASFLLQPYLGSELLPPSDEGEVRVSGDMDVATRIDVVEKQIDRMAEMVMEAVPEADSSMVFAGERSGDVRLNLVPLGERSRSNSEIAEDLRERLKGQLPGMEVRVSAPQGQSLLNRILDVDEDARLIIEIRGNGLDTLMLLSQQVEESIQEVEGVTSTWRQTDSGAPEQQIHIDRDKVADLGLSVRDVAEVLRTAIAGSQAGQYRVGSNSYRILVQLKNAEEMEIDEVLNLTISTPEGETVALRNLVSTEFGRAPQNISRKNQQRLNLVFANTEGRDMGSIASDIQERVEQIARPAGFEIEVMGAYEEQQKARQELMISFLLALLLVYMVLACQYESLRDPVIVMFATPAAAVGVILTLLLTDTTLNLQSGIGCIMLGGIVVNNAILLVDQAGRLTREGMSVHQAVTEAGRRRLRPILMTTSTTILALLPLAFGIGEGADAQAPLARAVIGGLTASTAITLLLIPALFSLVHTKRKNSPDA